MTKTITGHAAVVPGATPEFGKLIVTNLHYSDGSTLDLKNIVFGFLAPGKVTDAWSPTPEFKQPEITNTPVNHAPPLPKPEYHATVAFIVKHSETSITSATQFTFAVSGDLTKDPNRYTGSFTYNTK